MHLNPVQQSLTIESFIEFIEKNYRTDETI